MELVPCQTHVLDRWCVGRVIGTLGCIAWVWSLAASRPRSLGSVRFPTWGCCVPNAKTSLWNLRLCTVLSLLAFIHQGEAVNPGPQDHSRSVRQWSLGTFNPSGLGGKQQIINQYLGECDIWAVSETHLSSQAMHSFRQGLKWSQSSFTYCVGGCPVTLRSHSNKVGSWSGVAMLSKHPTRQVPIKWQPHSYETSRVLITSTLCADLWITGGVVYGEPPGTKHPDALQNTNLLTLEMMDHLCQSGGLRFLAGDFNFESNSLEVFQLLAEAGFRDLQDIAHERWGSPIRATCKKSTRKDFCFISPELQSMLIGIEFDDTIWADHAVLKGLFRGGEDHIARHYWRIPTEIKWPQNLSFEVEPDWYSCSDPSRQYEFLWNKVESAAVDHISQLGLPSFPKSSLGRAKTREVTLKHSQFNSGPVRKGRSGDLQPQFAGISQQHAHWFRQLRRVQAYSQFRKVHLSDTDQAHGTSLWSSILRGKGFPGGFCRWWKQSGSQVFGAPAEIPLIPPSHLTAEKIFESFHIDVRRLERNLCAERKKHAVTRRNDLAHMVFKDIQRQSPDRIDLLIQTSVGTVREIDPLSGILFVDIDRPLVKDKPIFIAGKCLDVIHLHCDEVCVPDTEPFHVGDPVRQTVYTGAACDLFRAFEQEWKARWDRHKNIPVSQWDQICAFGRRYLAGGPCPFEPLSITTLQNEIAKKRRRGVGVQRGLMEYHFKI